MASFYTTWLFKLERFILRRLVNKPSTDAEAFELARGERASFAAWSVEARVTDQIVMCDFLGRTRSWFMVEAIEGGKATRLYFGSAVVPKLNARHGQVLTRRELLSDAGLSQVVFAGVVARRTDETAALVL